MDESQYRSQERDDYEMDGRNSILSWGRDFSPCRDVYRGSANSASNISRKGNLVKAE
jgi:hypothetical protein